jgi:DNA-binding NarL/FixJ family response regulator
MKKKDSLAMITNAKSIHVALADDHKIFRDGIKMALKTRDYLKIIWEADDGKDLLHKLKLKMPDVVLMDINMPEMDGVNALQLIRNEHKDLKIVILSMYDDKEMITKMMELGANAYLTKTTDPDEIYSAILGVVNDDFYFNDLVNSAVLLKLAHRKRIRKAYIPIEAQFSEKELRIMRLIADDKTTDEISAEIFLSPRTIESIRQQMKAKANVKTIAGLVMFAMKNRLID